MNAQAKEVVTSLLPTRHIVKYPNRRLYDTHHHHYVTLKDVRSIVRQTIPVLVTEKKTGKDITTEVLLDTVVMHERLLRNAGASPLLSQKALVGLLQS